MKLSKGIYAQLIIFLLFVLTLISCVSFIVLSVKNSKTVTGDHRVAQLNKVHLTSNTTYPNNGQWLTYNGSNARTGIDNADGPFNSLYPAWTTQLDAAEYGQPLVYGQYVYVATINDTVYALNAANGAIVWSNHLATPVPSSDLPCGDINTVGIVSTPAIDPALNEIFVVGDTLVSTSQVAQHVMWGLDTSTGKLVTSTVVDPPGMVPLDQLQRAALAIANGYVYIGFGGNDGDCGTYHGYVVGAPESGSGTIIYYQVPTQREGAIWAVGGVSVDQNGNVYAATGNGSSTTTYDYGDSVLKLSPSLSLESYFAPQDWATYNQQDADLGSVEPLLLPNGYVFQTGKEQTGFLLNGSSLGGLNGQLASINDCFSIGASSTDLNGNVYIPCLYSGIEQIKYNTSTPSLSMGWSASSQATGSPIIAGGVILTADSGSGYLYALDPQTGQTVTSVYVGNFEHFQAPSVGDGLVLIGGKNSVRAFIGQSPQITSITPDSSSLAGGETVTIIGTNFSSVSSVSFGSTNATSFNVLSNTELTATVPASSSPGIVDVNITNAAGTSTQDLASKFLYVEGGQYVPINPVRIADTRTGATDPATYAGDHLVGGNAPLLVTVVNANSDNVPSNASAVALNIATVHPTNWDFVTVWPAGLTKPAASSLNNSTTVSAEANLVIVPLGQNGQVAIANAFGTTDVVVDVEGYFAPSSSNGSFFNPIGPFRLADTRIYSTNTYQDQGKRLDPNQSLNVTVAGLDGIPQSATAVVINVTATNTTTNGGFLTVYPAGQPLPNASTLNYDANQSVPNRAIVMVGASGQITVSNFVSTADVIVDIVGYFSSTGATFYPLAPTRIVDTRNSSNNPYQGKGNPLVENVAQTYGVSTYSPSGVPSKATSVLLNATVTNTAANGGFLTVFAAGTSLPATSDLNWYQNQTVANCVVALLGSGQISVEAQNSNTDLIIDVYGYFQ